MSSNPYIEQMTITKLLTSKNSELLVKINPNTHFANTDLQKLYLLIRNHFVEHGEWITFDHLASKVVSLSTNNDKAMFMASLIEQLKSKDVSSLSESNLLEELQQFSQFRLITDRADKLISAVQSKNIEDSLVQVKGMYEDVFALSESSTEAADLGSIARNNDKLNFRTTGIKDIDKHSGLAEGSLCLVGAESGRGKSILSHSIVCHQHDKYDSSSAYYSFEQGKGELAARIWSYYSDVNLGNLVAGTISDEERFKLRLAQARVLCETDGQLEDFCKSTLKDGNDEFFELLYNTYKQKDKKIYLYDHSPDFDTLMVEAELLAKTKNVKLFIFDYLTIIGRGSSNKQLAQWEYYLYMSKEMKKFARKNKVFVISPMQLDTKKDELKVRMASNIINDADLGLGLSQNADDATLGVVNVKFMKYRNFTSVPGQVGLKDFKMLCDFETAKFREFAF